jgi:hypothetical protein
MATASSLYTGHAFIACQPENRSNLIRTAITSRVRELNAFKQRPLCQDPTQTPPTRIRVQAMQGNHQLACRVARHLIIRVSPTRGNAKGESPLTPVGILLLLFIQAPRPPIIPKYKKRLLTPVSNGKQNNVSQLKQCKGGRPPAPTVTYCASFHHFFPFWFARLCLQASAAGCSGRRQRGWPTASSQAL